MPRPPALAGQALPEVYQAGRIVRIAAAIRQTFNQPDRDSAGQTGRHAADQRRPAGRSPPAAMDETGHNVLALMAFPARHRPTLHGTSPSSA